MSKKLAIVEKNVLFYSELPSEYHPLHHIHKFLFSLGDALRPESVMCVWRMLRGSVSSLKASPIILVDLTSLARLALRGTHSFFFQYR